MLWNYLSANQYATNILDQQPSSEYHSPHTHMPYNLISKVQVLFSANAPHTIYKTYVITHVLKIARINLNRFISDYLLTFTKYLLEVSQTILIIDAKTSMFI